MQLAQFRNENVSKPENLSAQTNINRVYAYKFRSNTGKPNLQHKCTTQRLSQTPRAEEMQGVFSIFLNQTGANADFVKSEGTTPVLVM